jgi:lysozyme family protein
MKVDAYIEDLIKREGGYVDHPADRGGPTMYGVTEQVARAYGFHGRMQDLPRTMAVAIYMERYWLDPNFHMVNEHAPAVAEELLDTGVNMGQSVASEFFQRMLNVLNKGGAVYPDLKVDGRIGKITILALRSYLAHRGSEGRVVLLRGLNCLQGARYVGIAENKESQEAFMHGWLLHRVVV